MANPMNVDDNKFLWEGSITKKGTSHLATLSTGGKYVDKDIDIEVSVASAEMKVDDTSNGELSATASFTDASGALVAEGASNASAIKIVANAKAEAEDVVVKTTAAGFTDTTDSVTVSAEDKTDSATMYIKKGKLEGDGDATISSTSVKLTKGGTGAFTVVAVADGGATVTEAGWLDANTTADSSASTTYAVQAAEVKNAATSGVDYTLLDNSGALAVDNGFLFINEGYIGNSKISIAELVPDDANVTAESAPYIQRGTTAYDKDGKLITGTMDDATLGDITAEDAFVNIQTVTVAADGDKFKVTGEGDISGTTAVQVATVGYADADLKKTGTISGVGQVNATLDVISTGVSFTGDGAVTPVITADAGSTAKLADEATTTQPTSGHYVAVSTAKIVETVTVTPTVTGAGYGTTDKSNATSDVVTAGANASGVYYVPVQEGSWSSVAQDSSVVAPVTTVTTAVNTGDVTPVTYAAKADGKQYVTITAGSTTTDGSVQTSSKITVSEGYVEAGSKTEVINETVAVADAAATAVHIEVYDGSWV